MRLLLDAHAFYWVLISPETLSRQAREAVESPENVVFFSTTCVWELVIKGSKRGLRVPDDVVDQTSKHGYLELSVRVAHALKTADLPPIHRDPFDRILVAQALVEGLTIVTRDDTIPKYGVPVLRA